MSLIQWTPRMERAACLVAEDTLTNEAIAADVGITCRSLDRWKTRPAFKERVRQLVEEAKERVRQEVMTTGIAYRVNRIRNLSDRLKRMQQVIEERAADPEMEGVPGGQTGLLVHQVKGVGKGEDFQLIDLYAVDAGLLKEMREHEKQAAVELGQWTEQHDIKLPLKAIAEVSMEDL